MVTRRFWRGVDKQVFSWIFQGLTSVIVLVAILIGTLGGKQFLGGLLSGLLLGVGATMCILLSIMMDRWDQLEKEENAQGIAELERFANNEEEEYYD